MSAPDPDLSPKAVQRQLAVLLEAAQYCADAGDWQRVEGICEQVLAVDPAHQEAAYFGGRAALMRDDPDAAEARVRPALGAHPTDPELLSVLGQVHTQRGATDHALACYRAAVHSDEKNPRWHVLLGLSLYRLKVFHEAALAYERAVELEPENPEYWYNLGIVRQRLEAHDEAVRCYRRTVELDPGHANGHRNLGWVFAHQGKNDESIAAYERALALEPDSVDVLVQLGTLCHRARRFADAVAYLQRAANLAPGRADVHNNLGNAYQALGDTAAACSVYEQALALRPDFLEALRNLGFVCRRSSQLRRALACYERLLELAPEDFMARCEAVRLRQDLCDWHEEPTATAALLRETLDRLHQGELPPVSPFVALSLPFDPARQQAIAAQFCRHRILPGKDEQAPLHRVSRDRPRRLKIGYVSPNFRDHATAHLMVRMLELHDHEHFEIYGYSIGPADSSEYRRRIVEACDQFVDITDLGMRQAAERIADDGIHVLVDRAGYTYNTRPQIFALRPAPIQVNYIGFPGTLGAPYMDYIIADEAVVPPRDQVYFSESVVYMPHSYLVTDDTQAIADGPLSRAQCNLPEDAFVFCSFNNAYKIDPTVFDVWMRILRQVPGSVLWLLGGWPETEANLKAEARARGVDPQRLVFAGRVPKPEHLARHRLADLFLDTRYYNAHTTAVDALWTGLPVLTCAGAAFPSRVAASVLHAAGLGELVCYTLADYERRALELARQPATLARVRALAGQAPGTPLFDTVGYTRALERRYERMWARYRVGERPSPMIKV